MATQEKINKIRNECIKANPEIVGLKFGCKIIYVNLSNVKTDKEDCDIDYDELNWNKEDECEHIIINDDVISNDKIPVIHRLGIFDAKVVTEIIGRDIRLADVLYMLSTLHSHMDVVVGTSGRFYYDEGVLGLNIRDCGWNLLDDNLEHQSPECIDFIYNLIENNA